MRLGLKEVTIYLCKKQQSSDMYMCTNATENKERIIFKCANGHDCENAAAQIVTKGCQ